MSDGKSLEERVAELERRVVNVAAFCDRVRRLGSKGMAPPGEFVTEAVAALLRGEVVIDEETGMPFCAEEEAKRQ